MNETLINICVKLLRNSLGLKSGEAFLVVTDEAKKDLASALYEAGKLLSAETMLITMQERKASGEEPPAAVAHAMAQADAVVCITEHSLTHTHARKQAAAAGARVATMPKITEDMFLEGAISADYDQVKALTERVTALLSQGSRVRIEKEGYALSFSIEGRQGVPSTGVYLNPGESGNLPSGEAFIAPVEGTASGQILIDGSVADVGKLASTLLLTLEQGRLVRAEGHAADRLLSILGEGDGRLLGEFGIGTNDKARITGNVLEDEKVYGTIHVAFGSNNTFGGTTAAGVHIDVIAMKPDVYIDDILIMQEGKLLFLDH